MNPEIDAMIINLERARNQLDSAVELAIPGIDIYPNWKLKQLLDHITGWDELMVTAFKAHIQDDPPIVMQANSLDQFNSRSLGLRAAMSIDESKRDYKFARQKVLDVLRAMPLEAFQRPFSTPWGSTCSIEHAVEIFTNHEEEHARQIIESLASQPGTA